MARPATPRELKAWVDLVNRTFDRQHLVQQEGDGIRIELPLDGAPGWRVSCLVVQQAGERVLVDLRIFPGPPERRRGPLGAWDRSDPVPAPGLTARLLRKVSVAELSELAGAAIEQASNPRSAEHFSGPFRDAVLKLAQTKPVIRTGRRGTPDEEYLPYAQAYDQAKARGSKTPVRDLANALGRKRDIARDLIRQCRSRDLLDAEGRLTEKAQELEAMVHSKKRRGR